MVNRNVACAEPLSRARRRRALCLAFAAILACALGAADAGAYSPNLTRYPYLTDSVQTSVTLNWATDQSVTTGKVVYGPAPGCAGSPTKSASKTGITVNGVAEYQWKAVLPVAPDTTYCYRVLSGATDLLAPDASPRFTSQVRAGSTAPFTFAVFGDWGQAYDGSANPDQANVLARMAGSGARVAVMTGDTAYPNGSQTNYGDLRQTGADISSVFAPNFWTLPGRSLPVFNVTGNHGYNAGSTQTSIWPEGNAAASSGGSYKTERYPSVGGSRSDYPYPSFWYAFDAGAARFYVLNGAWSDTNGSLGPYHTDAIQHFDPSSAQYRWLANDLATHPRALKFAFWHYPLYADTYNAGSDTYLQGGAGTLQGLLNANRVNLAFNGHAHGYERNAYDGGGMASYVFGNGGADLGPVGPCSSFDRYAIGAHGSACGGARGGQPDSWVFGFAKVTVSGQQVRVEPTDSLGQTYDIQTYTFPDGRDPNSGLPGPPVPSLGTQPVSGGAAPAGVAAPPVAAGTPEKSKACAIRRTGTKGANRLRGTSKGDRLRGLGGDDNIKGFGGDDCLYGNQGRDDLTGGTGKDKLYGGDGVDVLYGDSGRDRLSGGAGRDLLSGGTGDDVLKGGGGRNTYRAGRGNDRIYARNGVRDRIDCGKGRDRVRADRKDRVRRCERVSRARYRRPKR